MKIHGFCLFVLLTAFPVLAGQPAATPPGDSDEELARKIKDLNGQIQELRAKQDKLANEQKRREDRKAEKARLLQEEKRKAAEEARQKELARHQKEEAERRKREEAAKKKHYARVEIRGALGRVPGYHSFFITINQLNWRLDLGTDKALLAKALRWTIRDVPPTGPGGRMGKGLISKEVIIKGRFVNANGPVGGNEPQTIVIVESMNLVEE
jgi:hypothetical protein